MKNDKTHEEMMASVLSVWREARIGFVITDEPHPMGLFDGLIQPALHLPRQLFKQVMFPILFLIWTIVVACAKVSFASIVKTAELLFSLIRIARYGLIGRVQMVRIPKPAGTR